jgi:hypothetical protein
MSESAGPAESDQTPAYPETAQSAETHDRKKVGEKNQRQARHANKGRVRGRQWKTQTGAEALQHGQTAAQTHAWQAQQAVGVAPSKKAPTLRSSAGDAGEPSGCFLVSATLLT